jgi:hypothetical protein
MQPLDAARAWHLFDPYGTCRQTDASPLHQTCRSGCGICEVRHTPGAGGLPPRCLIRVSLQPHHVESATQQLPTWHEAILKIATPHQPPRCLITVYPPHKHIHIHTHTQSAESATQQHVTVSTVSEDKRSPPPLPLPNLRSRQTCQVLQTFGPSETHTPIAPSAQP